MYQSLENSICGVFPFQRNVCVTRCVTQLLVDSRSQCLLLNVTLSEQHSLPDRLVIGNTSYSLFFKGLLFRSLHCKTGKSFETPLSQWASFLHEKQLPKCWTPVELELVPSRDRISKRRSTTTIGLKCFANVSCYYRLCWVSYSSYNVLRLQVSEWSIYILILII